MANLIAIEINDEDVLVVAARTSGKRLQFTKVFDVNTEPNDTDAVVAEKLKKSLGDHGVPRGETIVVLGRQRIEMRDISVPPAPENELPEMVRFQARNDFPSFNENWELDYVPFDCKPNQPQRVLAGAVSPQIMEQTKQIVDDAGLKLSKMVLRPYSTCELFRAELGDHKARMIIDPNDEQFDLTLVTGTELLATRTVRTPKDYESEEVARKMVGQIRRTITSTAGLLEGGQLEEFLIVGAENRLPHMKQMLNENFEQTVTFVDPYTTAPGISDVAQNMPEHPDRFAALIGALIREASSQAHSIDFVNPRRPVAGKSNRSRALLWGGMAAALLICMSLVGWWLLSSQDARIAELNQDLRDLKNINQGDQNQPGVDQITGEVNLIDEWQNKNINWLDELYEFSQRFETPDDAIVDSMTLSANERMVGLNIKGRVNSIATNSVLKTNLTARPYLVTAGRVEEQSDDKDYPIKVESMFVELTTDLDKTIETINQLSRERLQNDLAPADPEISPTEKQEPLAPSSNQ